MCHVEAGQVFVLWATVTTGLSWDELAVAGARLWRHPGTRRFMHTHPRPHDRTVPVRNNGTVVAHEKWLQRLSCTLHCGWTSPAPPSTLGVR